jgi:hypothetical protein
MTLKTQITTAALLSLLGLATPVFAQDADMDGDGIPDTSEVLLGTDPMAADTDGDGQNDLADAEPTFGVNPIATEGAAAPFVIGEALVENNYDPVAKADATDHLELLVTNPGADVLTGFAIFFSITDAVSGNVESTYHVLDGFEVPAGGEARIHFDDAALAGHYRMNPNSIYTTSQAAKTFSVTLAATGFAPVTVEIAKDEGGPEEAD